MAGDVVITVRNNGSHRIKGTFRVAIQGGRELAIEEDQAWLYRCGHSLNKSFCDGSHKRVEFSSSLDVPAPGAPA